MAEKTELTDLLIYGIDIKSRRIYFGLSLDASEAEEFNEFNSGTVEMAIRAMHKMAGDAPQKPIEIHMNSYGGSVYAMLRLHDEILASPCQIKFFGGGAIMSAASMIMAVCDERYLHPHTTVMVHELSEEYGYSRYTDIKVSAAESIRVQEILYDIYEKNTRMPRDFWIEISQRDLYLTADEAVSLGLADKIIEPKKRGNLRKTRQAMLKKTPDNIKELVASLYSRINRTKIPKIHLNEPVKEPADPNVVIGAVDAEKPQQPLTVAAASEEKKE